MTRDISASQIGTFEDCPRFWWFERIMRLPQPPGPDHFTFGTVLHAVNERYLSATDNGRVPHLPVSVVGSHSTFDRAGDVWPEGPLAGQPCGEPVDLYPDGWETTVERDGSRGKSVTPTEARLIKRLVAEAIELGILQRGDDTTVERKVYLPVIDGVNLVGYIDVHRDANEVRPLPIIEDHKSYGKSSARFLKRSNSDSPNFLGADQQIRTYAWAISELDEHDGHVVVQHNQFPKFPGQPVTSVSAVLTPRDIQEHGEYLRDVAGEMVRVSKIKKWDDVPGPRDTGKCARWYGHECPHAKICGRVESPEQHKVRVSRLLESHGDGPGLDLPLQKPRPRGKANSGGNTLSIFDEAKKKKAAKAKRRSKAGAAKAEAAVPAADVNGGEAPAEQGAAVGGAPWANAGQYGGKACAACKGRGLTSKGLACPICDNSAKKAGRMTSMAYVLVLDDDDLGVAVAREEEVGALTAAGMELEWIEADAPVAAVPAPEKSSKPARKKRAAKAKTPAPAEKPEEKPEEPAEEPPVPSTATRAAKKGAKSGKAGRPSVGLTILVGAVAVRGSLLSRDTITSAAVLARFGAELAEDMGAESYYDLDSFKRRDRLAEKAAYIAAELGRAVMIHPGTLGNEDVGSLVRALMGLPEGIEAVIVGTG